MPFQTKEWITCIKKRRNEENAIKHLSLKSIYISIAKRFQIYRKRGNKRTSETRARGSGLGQDLRSTAP